MDFGMDYGIYLVELQLGKFNVKRKDSQLQNVTTCKGLE